MNYSEACRILEVSEGSSEDEIKKQFRKLAATYHPDKNKDNPEAANKSKQISEAFQFLKQNNFAPVREAPINIGAAHNVVYDFFMRNGVGPQPAFRRSIPSQISISISFAEAALGCSKNINLDRDVPCEDCQGARVVPQGKCDKCQGLGYIKQEQHTNMEVRLACNSCRGTGQTHITCVSCKQTGVKKTQHLTEIRLPAGVVNGQILKLPGGGNFIPEFLVYQDAQLKVQVQPDPEFSMQGEDIISTYKLSLLEALQGKTVEVRTVLGNNSIIIPPRSKHQQEIAIANHGVGKKGKHIVRLQVDYPDNVTGLINYLKGK